MSPLFYWLLGCDAEDRRTAVLFEDLVNSRSGYCQNYG